jgi:hypothetical protein
MSDPTKQEMLDLIHNVAAHSEMDEIDDFDIEGAIYWYAAHWHGGQNSNLYSALSTSKYSPGMLENGPEEGSMTERVYSALDAEFS